MDVVVRWWYGLGVRRSQIGWWWFGGQQIREVWYHHQTEVMCERNGVQSVSTSIDPHTRRSFLDGGIDPFFISRHAYSPHSFLTIQPCPLYKLLGFPRLAALLRYARRLPTRSSRCADDIHWSPMMSVTAATQPSCRAVFCAIISFLHRP